MRFTNLYEMNSKVTVFISIIDTIYRDWRPVQSIHIQFSWFILSIDIL